MTATVSDNRVNRALRFYEAPIGKKVVMAVTGPFGSYETMGLGKRLLYFAIIGVLSWALVIGCIVALRQIEAYNRCRRSLLSLDVEPSPETQALYEQVAATR